MLSHHPPTPPASKGLKLQYPPHVSTPHKPRAPAQASDPQRREIRVEVI